MSTHVVPAAASSLLTGLLATGGPLVEVARTRLSVHYETTAADVPVLSVCDPRAVRLPNSVQTSRLPAGPLAVVAGALVSAGTLWRVGRWWRPARPHDLVPPASPLTVTGVDVPVLLRPHDLVGAGPGLTPSGDDVLAGALVAAHATADPRLARWQAETRAALAGRGTTAVSRALLHHALDGWSTPELAAFVTAACAGDVSAAAPRLLAVGHTSGASLAAGALHVLNGQRLRGAA